MLLNRDPLNDTPLNGRGYVPVTYWPGAFSDGSYCTAALAATATDGSHIIAVVGFNATDGSHVMQALKAFILRVLNVDNAAVASVPIDKSKTWAAAGTPLNLETGGYIPHVRVCSQEGKTVYKEGTDYVLEDV